MEKLPASAGWQWVKLGFALFRKQPGSLMALLFCCMFLAIACLLVPILGSIAPIMLTPLFSVALLQACARIDRGERAMPNLLFIAFRKPARGPLLRLGMLHLLLILVAVAVLSWMDDGLLFKMAAGDIPVDIKLLKENSSGAMFVSSAICTFGWMVSCFAAPLIFWQKMKLGKALFFSVVAVFRGIKAFLAGALILFVIDKIATAVPALLFDSLELEATLILAVFLIMVVLLHCTLYVSYRQVFGAPLADETTEPASPQDAM